MINLLKISILFLLFLFFGCKAEQETTLLFVGSYTEGKPGKGIYVYELDSTTGKLELRYTQNDIINPSFLQLSTNGKYLYAVTESQLPKHGTITSFSIDPDFGKLTFLNKQDAGGRNPVHIALHPSGKFLISANYTDPSLSVLPLDADGSLLAATQTLKFRDSSVIKGRQDGAHIHSSNFSLDGNYLFAQDLGADKIRTFAVHEKDIDLLQAMKPPYFKMKSGSGPRHFTFHPKEKFAYSVSELSGKITAFQYDNGQLEFIDDYLSYSKKQEIYRTADVHISPDGKFLYASNRGPEEDSISIFSIDTATGRLQLVDREPTYGEHPRNFAIDPSGEFLLVANQFSGNVVIFKRHSDTGKLTKLSQELAINNPSSLQMHTYKN